MMRLIGKAEIEALKAEALAHPKKRSRIILHTATDTVTEMIIALHKDSYIQPHWHPNPESYHVLEGEMMVNIFYKDGGAKIKVKLDSETPFLRMREWTYHQPLSLTDFVIYHEVYPGPFEKTRDVHYAAWAIAEAA